MSRFARDTLPEMMSRGLWDEALREEGRFLNKHIGRDAAVVFGDYIVPAAYTVAGTILAPGVGTAVGAGMGRLSGSQIAGHDMKYSLDHALGDAAIGYVGGNLGNFTTGLLAGAMPTAPALAVQMGGQAIGNAATNSAVAGATGGNAAEAAIAGGVAGGLSPLTPYLGGQLSSATGLGGGASNAISGMATGAGGYAATSALLGRDIDNMGLAMSGGMGGVKGYLNYKESQKNPAEDKPMTGPQVGGMLLGASAGAVGKYFADQAKKPYIPGQIPFVTAPEWAGALSSGGTSGTDESAKYNASAQNFDWQRKQAELQTQEDIPVFADSGWRPVTGILDEQQKEEEVAKKNINVSNKLALYRHIA